MEAELIPQKYRDRICEMIATDRVTYHFLWDCVENTVIQFGRHIFPENETEPLDYLCEHGYIEEGSLSAFAVFGSRISEAIISGIDKVSLSVDVNMRFDLSEDFRLCRFISMFLRDENNRVTDIHINVRPYSKQETEEREIISHFTSDKNPQIFGKRVREFTDSVPANKQIAYIQFDVERFKLINETYGSDFGDELLKFFKDSLGIICREDQPFQRLTSDVFMIVTAFDEESEILDFINKIESLLSGYKGVEYRLIFGVAVVEDRSVHTRRNGDNATLARQSIKGNALNNIGFYKGDMKSSLKRQQNIEDEMHKALIDGEFVMYLQPKYSISTEKIIGAEALARWIHPERGMISPADFIPIFEKNGFILKLDQYIWECACRKIRSWIDAGITPVPISVNVSREYLLTFDVAEKVSELIKKYDIPSKLLELEITESLDTEGVEAEVAKMKAAGFTMLMDDFGSGYSSLNMLKTTQFDVLKIDRSFLSEFMDSERGRKIISHTISMSRDIGLNIIAEGVETKKQAEFLSDCGCDAAQGFYYSKPIPESEFDKYLLGEQ